MTRPPKREPLVESEGLPALDLDEQLGSFVRQRNKRQVFARLFGDGAKDETLGRYRLLRHLGQGGMGVVYAAHDDTLDRTVAIKLVRTDIGRHRLLREGQAMARLTHPNVVRVYEVGEAKPPGSAAPDTERIAYIAMEFVDGVTLAQWLREPRTPVEIIAAFIAAGRGLWAAHEVGLVHRDFKPQNVLVHRDGRVLVTDFGLARERSAVTHDLGPGGLEGGDGLMTSAGLAGTPAYMAPEALAATEVGPYSDQFGFCVALWEALYGHRPFQGSTLTELSHDLQTRELERTPPVRSIKLPRGIHEALVRGLALEPAARWPDMRALLDELERAKTRRWLVVVALVGLAISAPIVVVLIVLLRSQGLELEHKDRDLARELELSERARHDLETSLSVQRGMRAINLIDDDSEGEALLLGLLAVGAHTAGSPPPVEASEGLAAVLADDAIVIRPELRQHGPSGTLTELSVSPSGDLVAIAGTTIALWNLDSDALRTLEAHTEVVHTVDFSPDNTRLVSGSRDTSAKIWDLASGAIEHELTGHSADITVARFSPDGEIVATGSLDHDAKLWDASSGALVATLRGHQDFVNGLVYAPGGARLATRSYDGSARIWDLATGAQLASMIGHEHVVSDLAFSPDGEQLATASFDGSTRLWDANTGEFERELERRPEAIYTLAFAPDGRQLATGGRRGVVRLFDLPSARERAHLDHFGSTAAIHYIAEGAQILTDSPGDATRIWDADTGRLVAKVEQAKFGLTAVLPGGRLISAHRDGRLYVSDLRQTANEVRRLRGHREPVTHVAFSPDGAELATACDGGEIKLWDPRTGALRATLAGAEGSVFALAYAPSGAVLAAGGEDHHIRLWDPRARTLRVTLRGHTNYVEALAFSPDGRKLASTSLDYTARLWDLDGETSVVLPRHRHGGQYLAFSRDGQRLASTDATGVIHWWDADDGHALGACARHEGPIEGMALSPDGKRLASVGTDELVKLGLADSCAPAQTLAGHDAPVHTLAFSPDGRILATGAKQVHLWEVSTGALLRVLGPDDDAISDLVFSTDGQLLASADLGSTIMVWRVATGELVASLDDHTGSVRDLALAPDGSSLASASADHSAKLWDLERGALRITLTDRIVLDRGAAAPVWPIPPPTLLQLGCARIAPFAERAQASEVCDPIGSQPSQPGDMTAPSH